MCIALFCASAAAVAATHEVQVISFRFEPASLTIAPGDTVIWRNTGGIHNVLADDRSFGNGAASSAAWTYSRVFDAPGDFGYYCEPHGGPGGAGMAGMIKVAAPAASFAINYGIGGTWYNPATSGQGFFVEVVPSLDLMVIAWFTWTDTPGEQDWFTAIGPISGDSATLDLQRSSGGRFNDPATVATASVGSVTARFTDCGNGTISFQRSDTGQSGSIPIQRLTVTPSACTSSTAKD